VGSLFEKEFVILWANPAKTPHRLVYERAIEDFFLSLGHFLVSAT
jgi:hypothetical protein